MPALSPDKIAELEAFLLELNAASAEAIRPHFRAEHGMVDKNVGKGGGAKGFDPVTEADKGAERAIRKLIAERYPEHGVVGEEYGEDRPDAEFVWITDPVDGTRAFVAGLPLWCTLIGLRVEGRQILGTIGQPFLGEVFLGSPAGSRLVTADGETPLKVRACPVLTEAVIATTDPERCFDGAELGAWRQVRAAARLARLGCDAYAYAMVAAGQMDLVVEAGLAPWDVAGLVPLIENAGGVVTDWRGAPMPERGGQIAIAGDRACLDEALVALKRSAK